MCAVVLYSYDGNNIYSGESILGIHNYITQIEAHLLNEYEHYLVFHQVRLNLQNYVQNSKKIRM